MYSVLPSFVLGFHGCDRAVAESVLSGESELRASENEYDWLGHGMYFWENNPRRALQFAQEQMKRKRSNRPIVKNPYVLGAVVDLGYCLNLLDAEALEIVSNSHDLYLEFAEEAGLPVPENKAVGESKDLLLRPLDCAVIQFAHKLREAESLRPFDTIRGAFWEGTALYPNAGFGEKNHVQVCVRNPNCIKGYFRVREPHSAYPIP